MKKEIIKISAYFIGAIIFLVGVVIVPLVMSVNGNLEKFVSLKKEVFISGGNAEAFQKVNDSYKRIKVNLDKENNLFIDPQAPIGLIEFWEKTANDYHLLISISPNALKANKKDPWNSIGFQINLTGSYPDFLKFLEKIEASFYLVKIKSLAIVRFQKSKNKTGEKKSSTIVPGSINAKLIVKVFTK